MAFSDIYFKSKDIKVFPSSFRGTYETSGGSTLIFDPEARLNTESNYICPKTTSGKDTYIVSADTTSIKFVLGGYYFELNSLSDYKEKLKGKYIGVKSRSVTLKDGGDIDTTRATKVLDSWESTSDNILDFKDESEENVYYFSGLKFGTPASLTGSSAQIKLLDDQGNLDRTYLIPNLQHGAGENTLLHGEGLKAASNNQTIFGKYNDNKTNTVFEVGIGTAEDSLGEAGTITQKNRKNALEVYTDKTVINTALSITEETAIANNLEVNATKTVSKKPLEVTDGTASTSADTGALKVSGGAGIGKNLNVGENANLGNKLIVKTTPTESETTVKVDGTLNITGKTTVASNVAIDSDKTILSKPVEITDSTANALKVTGRTTLNDLTVNNTASLGDASVEGSFSVTATEAGKTINLEGSTTIKGTVAVEGSITSNQTIDDTTTDNTLVPKSYVEGRLTALTTAYTTKFENTTSQVVNAIKGNSKYVQSVTQADGKVRVTEHTFDSEVTATSTSNAPTTSAVHTFVESSISTALKELWNTDKIDYPISTTESATKSLKAILLDAIYPVGSIYIQYVDSTASAPTICPIQSSLEGVWALIDSGTFLRAVGENAGSRGLGGGFADTQLIAHYHELERNWDMSTKTKVVTTNNGLHGHNLTLTARAHDASADTGLRSGNPKEGGCHQYTFMWTDAIHQNGEHAHTVDLTNIKTAYSDGIDITKVEGTNLPPYLNVYMWKRTN